jgi:histidine triad (HIT) family protein
MASVFTLIMTKKLPGHFVWEDEHCIAIMTIQPIREGHLLVIPREEIDQWSDVPVEVAAHLMKVSHTIANAMKKVFTAQRIGLMIAGLEVPHTHIHLVPMDSMADLDFAYAKNAEAEDLAKTAAAIRAALEQDS